MKAAASARPLPLSPLLDALRHTLPNFGAKPYSSACTRASVPSM